MGKWLHKTLNQHCIYLIALLIPTQGSDGYCRAIMSLPDHLPLPIQPTCPLCDATLIVALVCLEAVENFEREGSRTYLLHLDPTIAASLSVRRARA